MIINIFTKIRQCRVQRTHFGSSWDFCFSSVRLQNGVVSSDSRRLLLIFKIKIDARFLITLYATLLKIVTAIWENAVVMKVVRLWAAIEVKVARRRRPLWVFSSPFSVRHVILSSSFIIFLLLYIIIKLSGGMIIIETSSSR